MAFRLFRAFRAKHPSLVIASVSLTLAALLPLGTSLSGAPQSATTGGTQISTPVALVVDGEPLLSDGNGVFELGERVEVAPAWRNGDSSPQSLTGTASAFTGPPGPTYDLVIDSADYGVVGPGEVAGCQATGSCYAIDIGPQGVERPVEHWDARFDETLSDGTTLRWALHVGDSFADVPRASPFYRFIETVLHHGVTAGCGDAEFCPTTMTSRAQMPVLVLKALEGSDYVPPPCEPESQVFADVPFDSPFCPWIEELFFRGVVAGCGGGNYCPAASVTRAQAAVFLLETLEGVDYEPPPCSGVFADVSCPSLFGNWIEDLFARQVTAGCGSGPPAYCPAAPVTRQQMVVFVTRTFGLTLYGPGAQNNPPVVSPATFTLEENGADGTVVGTVTFTDPDAGQSHTFAITAGNTDGAFAIGSSTGEIMVANSAALDFETHPTFTLTVEVTDDGTPPSSGSATVTVELANVNEPPTAVDDLAVTDEDNAMVLDVLSNDSDPDAGDTFVIVAIGGSPMGDVVNNGSDISYDPTAAFDSLPQGGSAVDSFTYTIEDASGLPSTATVTVTVGGLNDAPIAGDDTYSAIGNTQLAVEKDGPFDVPTFSSSLDDVLADDADPDVGDTVSVLPFSGTLPSGAELDLAADGSFFYTPPAGQITPDSFTYTVEDSFGATDIGEVTIDIAKRVWYVDNTANGGAPGTGSGTATDPFSTLSDGDANSDPDDAEDTSAAGDILYVHQGDGSATNQAAGITLKTGQQLLGEGVDLVVDPDDGGPEPPATLFQGDPENRPRVTHAGAGSAVTVLANTASGDRVGLEIRGLELSSTGGNAIDVTSADSADLDIRIADNVVSGSGAEGIDINVASTDASQTLALHDNTVTATGSGIDVLRTAGTLTITAFGNNTVTDATGGAGISVSGGSVIFDAVPGGSFDTVAGGALTIGASGDPVGGGGMALVGVSGDLTYSSIDIHVGNGPGLAIGGTGQHTGTSGMRFRHLTPGTGVIVATGDAAVDLDSLTADLRLGTVSSSNSPGSGVRLVSLVDGAGTTAQFSAGAGSNISNAAGTAFLADGGNATVSYAGTIANSSSRSVQIENRTADTITFTGNVSDTGTGVLLNNNNAASTVTFAGGLQLSTGTSAAFTATGGGTVNVCDENPCDPSSTGLLANTLTTTTATAINVSSTTIGANGVTLRSIDSTGAGANTAIVLANTGAGPFHVTGTGSSGTGGTISSKTVDAMTMNNTDGSVTLRHMIFQDLGNMTGGIDTISGHDAIHGQQVDGGLVLDGVIIRRVSDNAIHGGTLPGGAATVWNGLTLNNVTIEDSNRFHVADAGDANNEGMVRILGIRGNVSITNSTLQRGGELVDFFVTGGALNMTATNNVFHYAYKEFTTGVLASIGNHCIDVTVQNDGDASVVIGDRTNDALDNDFLNCAVGSVRVAGDAGATGDIDVVIGQNEFTVDDHSSTLGADFFFPMGGVLVGSLGSDSASYDVVIDGNYFDEITNASGGVGQLTLAMTNGTWQVLVEDNTFDTPGNAPWFVRADSTVSASVLFRDNVGIKGAFCSPDPSANGGGCDLGGGQLCPGAAGYCGPGLRTLVDLQNGANVDLTIINDDFAEHDAGFDPGQTFEARVLPTGGGGMLCLDLQNNDAPDGYSLEEFAGDFDLIGSGTCPAGSPSPGCQTVLGNRGNRGGGGVATTVPPFVNVEAGSTIDVVAGSCQQPTGPIF